MDNITSAHIIGAVITLLFFIGLGIQSGKKVKSESDFSGGKSSGMLFVAGGILGTLVGGNSTIGTAQLAFTNGLSAWWFTLGSSLGCLVLGLLFTKPLRQSECKTIQQIIRTEYGETAGVVTSVLTSLGIILNIVAQILASSALLTTLFRLSPFTSSILSIVIMASFVVFGGLKGAGLLGVIKLLLLYIAVLIGGYLSLKLGGGFNTFYISLPHEKYFNLFSRGFGIDFGAGLSVLLGVLSTQTYIQSILSGKSSDDSKKGALLSALLIPPIGILSIFVGMYMKLNYPGINAGQAFPIFVVNHMPPLFAGIVLATLLIAIVGTGSGMALGFGTIFTNDIYKRYINKNSDGKTSLLVTRIIIIISLIVSAVFTNGNLKSAILTWGFMSMGLRAVVLFLPMCAAIFLKGRIDKKYAISSSTFGLVSMLVGSFVKFPYDTLFLGMATSLIIMIIGYVVKNSRSNNRLSSR